MPSGLRPLLPCLLICSAALAGCDTGYRTVNGQPVLVTWDAGNGRREHVLQGADPATFKVLIPKKFAKDKRLVFYGTQPIEGADAATFTLLNDKANCYSKDKNRVYMLQYEIPEADPASFELLQFPYSRDAKQVFSGNEKVAVANLAAFDVLGGPGDFLSVDFYEDGDLNRKLKIPRIECDGWAKCGNDVFFGATKLDGADAQSFEALDKLYAKDRTSVYFKRKRIVGADAATFTASEKGWGEDKNRRYLFGEPR